MADTDASFLGTGWGFPPAFGPGGSTLEMVSGPEDIQESLQILLSTSPGERLMQDTFGCALGSFLFEPMTSRLVYDIKDLVSTALLYHEPRLVVEAVEVYDDEDQGGLLLIEVSYRVIATNSRYNMVYPFHIQEAAASLR